ncbi:hypothetical protein [uncultured Gammaproteobacteria bacterium]|nr:hypothetical protein [uncultured Gammaproteobacteria bacterium]
MQLFLQQIYNIIVINIFTRYYFKYYKFYYINIVSQPLKTQFKITKPYLITSFCILQHKPMILYKKIANLL